MPRFTYVSRDQKGQRVTAVAEAESRQALLGQLKDRGLAVVQISELNGYVKELVTERQKAARPFFALTDGVSASDLAIFWRELATMVAAGLPVVQALESIVEELEHARLRKVLGAVIASMWQGLNFSQSIKRHPRVFSPMVIALIGAAEESGSLSEVSGQLATYLENRDRLRRKVIAALTYPIFLCGFFLVVMAIATFWLIPKFREIYDGLGAKLPWLTQTVFTINAAILHYLPWLAVGAVGVILGLILWARKPSGRAAIDKASLRIPIFGKLLQQAAVSRFCRSLSILLSGGIPINRALEMAQETSGNTVVSKAIKESREEILKGGKIAASLKHHKIFPHLAIRMVSVGEETGSLGSLLEKTADFYEARVDAALTTINALIEPVMIVIIGCFVLIFVLSMYLPIFSLADSLKT